MRGPQHLALGCILPVALGVAIVAADLAYAATFTGGAHIAQAATAGTPAFFGVSPVTDGAGGAIFVWADSRLPFDANLYAGRIGSDGTLRWPGSGVPACTAPADQRYPGAISDGLGGAFIDWTDARPGGTTDIPLG